MADITKLRKMTGAGMMDCKNALTQANNDFDEAVKIIREKGKAVAAKRSDRDASEGCVLVKVDGNFGAMIALKCETDFVANGADFIALTQNILDAAIAAKAKSLEEVKELTLADGQKVQDAVTQRSGITGEKMELDGYLTLEGENIEVYNHMKKNTLCTMVQTNKLAEDAGHKVAMQVAAMKPVALDAPAMPQSILDEEYKVAVEKTKEEQVSKAVDNALKKAGINPAHVDSEDHMESNMAKGWITAEDVAKAKEIIATVSAEKAASLPAQMVENIAKGRVAKFLKENCLVDQEFQFGDGDKATVAQWLAAQDKELKVVAFQRFTLVAD